MNRLYMMVSAVICCSGYGIQTPENFLKHPYLGRTHFIVGLPPLLVPETLSQDRQTPSSTTTGPLKPNAQGSYCHAFFSPDDNLESILVHLIDQEETAGGISVAIFSFTNGTIAQAFLEAHKRGVAIEIITDISCLRDKFNKIELLQEHGITVHIYNPRNKTILNDIMHNKFVIFRKNRAANKKQILWTGSFNFTKSAQKNNKENIVILDDPAVIERYHTQFARLKECIYAKKPVTVARAKKRASRYVQV